MASTDSQQNDLRFSIYSARTRPHRYKEQC